MAKKEFTKFELARMKRTAQNVEGFLKQKNKLEEKKAKIEEELAVINQQIELTDAPTVAMTGYHTEDIIKKVVTPTDQVDKNGNDYISEDESNSGTLDDYLKMTKLNLDIDRANLERAKFEEQKRMNRINANKPRKS